MTILYGSTMSPFVRKVAAFAAEKGIDLELKGITLGDPDPEFRAASPFRKMPALVDGDFRLADSTAIIHYLEARFPDPPLIASFLPSPNSLSWSSPPSIVSSPPPP